MPFISIVTPTYNEADNVDLLYQKCKAALCSIHDLTYEHIFIDNNSTDKTVEKLRTIASHDKNIKVILNMRNFGQVRSPYHAILEAKGEAVIAMASDLQDPPELLPVFISKWLSGNKVVLAQKKSSQENRLFYFFRTFYYQLLRNFSEVPLPENTTGFGLYDREVIEVIRKINDPYPYFRGLILELGYQPELVEFVQPKRVNGISKNNLYRLFDIAMLGFTKHSKVPLRIATILGFLSSFVSILVALFYFIYKIIYWNNFSVGIAPLVVGIFFFSSVQLFFLGIVGEYVGAILTHVRHVPPVIEKERINFG
jgi:glycosyltransferase involved in cell wall biosynthesis